MRHCGTRYPLAVLCSLLIAYCGVGPVEQAGGDDFPNMIADAGGSITRNLDQQWENPASVVLDTSLLAPPSLPALTKLSGTIGKRSPLSKTVAADSIWYAVDRDAGTVTLFSRKDTLLAVKYDTLIFKVNPTDTMVVSFTGAMVGKIEPVVTERYRYTDYDGDSLLFSSAAPSQQILVEMVREGPGSRVEAGRFVLDCGPDGDFDTPADNRTVLAEKAALAGGDTVSSIVVRDADGDGYATDNGSDSCLVDLVAVSSAEQPLSLLQRTVSAVRMVVYSGNARKSYAIRYQVVTASVARTINWTIRTKNGDSTFLPGDTVDVVRTTTARGDSLDVDTMKLRVLLGSTPGDSVDDALLGIYLHAKYLRGSDREVLFDYVAATPIAFGNKPHNGSVYYKSIFRDDSWIEVEGVLDSTRISADVTGFRTDRRRYTVTWDYTGKVVSFERVE
jgi:hypothetical protein